MVIAVVLVTSGFTVKFNVASESQPADDVSVAVCEPAAINVKPFHEYGSRLSHIVIALYSLPLDSQLSLMSLVNHSQLMKLVLPFVNLLLKTLSHSMSMGVDYHRS